MEREALGCVPERENRYRVGRGGQTAATGSRRGRFGVEVNTT
jgi:hypothetical protein